MEIYIFNQYLKISTTVVGKLLVLKTISENLGLTRVLRYIKHLVTLIYTRYKDD